MFARWRVGQSASRRSPAADAPYRERSTKRMQARRSWMSGLFHVKHWCCSHSRCRGQRSDISVFAFTYPVAARSAQPDRDGPRDARDQPTPHAPDQRPAALTPKSAPDCIRRSQHRGNHRFDLDRRDRDASVDDPNNRSDGSRTSHAPHRTREHRHPRTTRVGLESRTDRAGTMFHVKQARTNEIPRRAPAC